MKILGQSGARRKARAGISIVEMTIALAIITTVLTAAAGAFVSDISATRSAQRMSRGTVFLETVLQDLSAQSYDALPSFNGDRVFDGVDEAHSNFSATLTVFLAGVDLQQVRAVLTDLRTGRELGRVITYRCPR